MSPPLTPIESAGTCSHQTAALQVVVPIDVPLTLIPRPMIEMNQVTKVFNARHRNGVVAVSKLTLTFFKGSATLITGASGSGKTTLLSLMGCLIRPTAGRISISGTETSRMPEEMLTQIRRCTFGFVFQQSLLIHRMSAIQNVMLPALPRPEVGADLRQKAETLLARFGLEDRTGDRVECLSGGEQQRVAIARALINDPGAVIADEPTAHLGSSDTQAVLDLFSELRSEGRTVVVASHDESLIHSGFFNQVINLQDGRLDPEGA